MNGSSRQVSWFICHYPNVRIEPVLDVGCGNAASLNFFGPGSIGLDGDDRYLTGPDKQRVFKWGFDQDIRATLISYDLPGQYKYVCCLNTMEHALAPHLHLLNLRRALKDDGYLYLTIPLARTRLHTLLKLFLPKKFSRFWQGYLQSDHVNFWVPDTFDLTVKYAGFNVVGRYYGSVPNKISGVKWLNRLLGELAPTYGVICRKIPDWNYKEKDSVWKKLNQDGFLEWVSRIE